MNGEGPTGSSSPSGQRPCPFCGHLVAEQADRCQRCKLTLDEGALRRMRKRLGPWFLLDEGIASGPGVNWEKLLSLVEQGKVLPESIVRGPVTGGLWRFARDTPSVATQLGMCWSCHAQLPDRSAKRCPSCRSLLNAPVELVRRRRRPPAAEVAASPIEDLAHAAAPDEGPPRPVGGSPVRRVGAFVSMLILLVGAATCFAIFWSVFHVASGYRHKQRPADPKRAAAGPGEGLRPESAGGRPSGAVVDRSPPQATSAPAEDPLPPEELARQRRLAEALFAKARALEDEGNLMAAQEALLKLLNTCHPDAWPEETAAAIRRLRQALGQGRSRPSFFGSEAP